jgi:uncharacterized protein with HEPN domain
VKNDDLKSCLANEERQDAIERDLIRFGEALKDIPKKVLTGADPNIEWDKPMRFRDLAAHWYEGTLYHELIWSVLKRDPPALSPRSNALRGRSEERTPPWFPTAGLSFHWTAVGGMGDAGPLDS